MKNLYIVCLMLCSLLAFSQEKPPVSKDKKDKNLPKGNKAFDAKDYATAEEEYRIAGSNAPGTSQAAYNLGNAIYRQKQAGESVYAYVNAIKNATTKPEKHKAYHNLGNALMQLKSYGEAVEAYKNALRNNPNDEETRYNYALAKDMLKKNPPPPPQKDKDKDKNGGGGGGNDKDQNKNQKPNDKDGKNKDKDKEKGGNDKEDQNKDKGDQKDKNKDKGDNKQDANPEPQAGQQSKDAMDRMLDAVNNEEKKLQDKVNARKVKAQQVPNGKDW